MARPLSFDPETSLRHAIDLLWSRGYGAVSVDDIVEFTSLNRHSLYGRYGSKLGLVTAAVDRYLEDALERLRQVFDAPGTPIERLQRLMDLRDPDVQDEIFAAILRRGCFAVRIAAEIGETHPEFRERVGRRMRWIEERIHEQVVEGQRLGLVRTDRPAAELAAIVAAGFFVPLVAGPDRARNRAILAALN